MSDERALEIADQIVFILRSSVGRSAKSVYDEVTPLCKEYEEERRSESSSDVPREQG